MALCPSFNKRLIERWRNGKNYAIQYLSVEFYPVYSLVLVCLSANPFFFIHSKSFWTIAVIFHITSPHDIKKTLFEKKKIKDQFHLFLNSDWEKTFDWYFKGSELIQCFFKIITSYDIRKLYIFWGRKVQGQDQKFIHCLHIFQDNTTNLSVLLPMMKSNITTPYGKRISLLILSLKRQRPCLWVRTFCLCIELPFSIKMEKGCVL